MSYSLTSTLQKQYFSLRPSAIPVAANFASTACVLIGVAASACQENLPRRKNCRHPRHNLNANHSHHNNNNNKNKNNNLPPTPNPPLQQLQHLHDSPDTEPSLLSSSTSSLVSSSTAAAAAADASRDIHAQVSHTVLQSHVHYTTGNYVAAAATSQAGANP
jgi:hypothetical protein